MSITRKRILTAALFLTVVLLLASCSADEQSDNEELPEYVYVPQYIPLPRDLGNISNITYFDNKIYFVASEEKEVIREQGYMLARISSVYSMNMDGTGLTELTGIFPLEIPADADKKSDISLTVDDDGNIWVYISWAYYTPGYYAYIDGGMNIRKLDPAGTELLTLDVRSIFGSLILAYNDIPQITIQSVAGKELIFISTGDFRTNNLSVRIFSTEGKMLMMDAFRRGAQLIKMPDGTVAIFDDTGMMYTPDISLGDFVENNDYPLAGMLAAMDLNIDTGLRFIIGGGRDFDMLAGDHISLFGFLTDDRETIKLFGWRENSIGIDYVSEIMSLPDGRIICLYSRMTDIYIEKAVIIILEKTLRSELPEITEITLAGVGIMGLQGQSSTFIEAVYDFNAANTEYQIKVVDYLQSDFDIDIQRLNIDIISGNIPDILFTDNLPLIDYAESGLLANLYPFIDADPLYDRNSFLQGALRAAEYDGKLYRIFSGFWLNSIIGDPAVVGPDMGWTLDEFETVLDAHPGAHMPIGDKYSSSDFLRNGALAAVINEYIDWEAGTVSFDSPQFIRFLEIVKRLGENVKSQHPNPIENLTIEFTEPMDHIRDDVRDGQQIMLLTQIRSFVYNYDYMYRHMFNTDIVIKGFPNEAGNGNVYSGFEHSLAIIDNSPNKDAAWSFVRTILDEEWQLDCWARRAGIVYMRTGFASNRAAFERHAGAVLSRHANAVAIGHLEPERAITQEDIDRILDIIDSTVYSLEQSDVLIDIICEEAEDYFSGTQSAEDAARIIQSRASIYLSEQN